MTQSRATQISLDDTPFYHCICRCVRRAFLCGRDQYSGQDYEHRRQWVMDRLATLVEVFSVDLCAYAVMSNHYHVVLRIDRDRAKAWSAEQVSDRWLRLFSGHVLVQRWRRGESGEAESLEALAIVESWRERLYDLGWFMKCLNEHLARRANEEDGCKGRFWESRYKSQALLDEKALLSCMAYVDLNPVRAGMAATPEASDFTSVQQRIQMLNHSGVDEPVGLKRPQLVPLSVADHIGSEDAQGLFGYRLSDYLQLVDATGRMVRSDKRGAITGQAPEILNRLGIRQEDWLRQVTSSKTRIPQAIGSLVRLKAFAAATGRRWVSGQRAALIPA
jgi:REP element-mobilizing transposase RayT